ncbi:MAG: response regulator transcription factor [Puniceicoccales bacterium]|jgi:DNA-binding response OmpR family regulator|nr:response regulator transcription factor [Puniceicoccales bacterium]
MESTKAKKNVLIIDDDRAFAEKLAVHIDNGGFATKTAQNAEEAEWAIRKRMPIFLFLNVGLCGHSGIEFLERLWRIGLQIPTIFIANRHSQEDPVRALYLGDDFQRKPLAVRELLARMGAILRRARMARGGRIAENLTLRDGPFPFCGATVYPGKLQVIFSDGSRERLGRLELGLLAAFAKNRGRILSRQELARAVWGPQADGRGRSLDQQVLHIRKVFRARNCEAIGQLCAIRGIGYLYGRLRQERSERQQLPIGEIFCG